LVSLKIKPSRYTSETKRKSEFTRDVGVERLDGVKSVPTKCFPPEVCFISLSSVIKPMIRYESVTIITRIPCQSECRSRVDSRALLSLSYMNFYSRMCMSV